MSGQAFEELYRELLPRVFGYFLYRLDDRAAAEDLTADVFLAALENLERYDSSKGSFDGWVFAIARNRLRNHLRSVRIRRLLPLTVADNRKSVEERWLEETVIDGVTAQEILCIVRDLNPLDRELIALKFGAGLSNADISVLVRLTPSNVAVRLYRAIRRIRGQVQFDGKQQEECR